MRGCAGIQPVAAGLLAAAVACTPNVAEKVDRPDVPQARPAARTVGTVRPQPAAADISFASSLYVERDVNVAARTSGIIEEVLVDRGARVSAGDPLAVMETDIARRELEIAEQEARRAKAEFDRIAPLYEKNVVSDHQYVEVGIARDQAVSLMELARARLERCTVRAPYDGIVVERWAIEGQRIQEDDGVPLFRVVAREPLRARVDVPEERLDSLGTGSAAYVEDLDGDATHKARVVFVSPVIDAASGTASIIVQMEEPSGHLRIGSAVRVRFHDDPATAVPAVRIPRSALANVNAHDGQETSVMVIDGGRAATRKVKILEARGASVVVEGDLSPDAQVILGGGSGLSDGEPVTGKEVSL